MSRIEEIKERTEKARKGPWEWDGRIVEKDGSIYHPQGSYLADTLICLGDTYEDDHFDLDFIAHAREDIPYLLTELSAARKEIEELKAERDEAVRVIENLYSCKYEPDKMLCIIQRWRQSLSAKEVER